jgi:RNA polymerase sigma factor (TIGR02999 family)
MVYMRLLNSRKVKFESRKHFFWYASQMIRRFLVDRIRERMTQKRGAGAVSSLEDIPVDVDLKQPDPTTLLAMDQALAKLEAENPRQCRIVEMRAFAGMTVEEIAEVMECSAATIKRDWSAAKRRLFFELTHRKHEDIPSS